MVAPAAVEVIIRVMYPVAADAGMTAMISTKAIQAVVQVTDIQQ